MLLNTNIKNAMLQGIADALNIGTHSSISIYIGEVLAVELDMPKPIEKSIIDGVLTFNKPVEVLAIESGVPTAAILRDASGADVATFEIGTELTLDKEKIYKGGYVGINSLTIAI